MPFQPERAVLKIEIELRDPFRVETWIDDRGPCFRLLQRGVGALAHDFRTKAAADSVAEELNRAYHEALHEDAR